jgi:hypothetical protein
MRDIVPDEQRRDGRKAARPFGVALGSSLEFVVALARGNRPALRATPAQQASQSYHGASS